MDNDSPVKPISPPVTPFSRPTRWEWYGFYTFIGILILFGMVVELRSCFMHRRMTDLDVFLRTSWAVRTGQDIYQITDDNGWHYHYPPLFAIWMVPLADAPAGANRSVMLPFPVSVALWYGFSVFCVAVAVHALASALEAGSADSQVRNLPIGCRRWWALRLLPVLACLPPVGHTLMRGQVNLLLLALLCCTLAAFLRGQSWRAGLWLGGAICLKVIPAFLILYPLWRRDGRSLAGCALGLVGGLLVIPSMAFGVEGTIAYFREYKTVLVEPALRTGGSHDRDKELIEITASDSQSFVATIHNTLYLDLLREARPPQPDPEVSELHWLLGGAMTLLTFLAAGWRRNLTGPASVVLYGALVLNMILLSPVCHLHYFCLSIPLVMGLLAAAWNRTPGLWPGIGLTLVLVIYAVANILPNLPGLEVLRDIGLAMYAALLLWGIGLGTIWKSKRSISLLVLPQADPAETAA